MDSWNIRPYIHAVQMAGRIYLPKISLIVYDTPLVPFYAMCYSIVSVAMGVCVCVCAWCIAT